MTLAELFAENDQLRAESAALQKRMAALEKTWRTSKANSRQHATQGNAKRRRSPKARRKFRPKQPRRKAGHAQPIGPFPRPLRIPRTLDALLPLPALRVAAPWPKRVGLLYTSPTYVDDSSARD